MSIKAHTLFLLMALIACSYSNSETPTSSDYEFVDEFSNLTTIVLKLNYTGNLSYYLKPSSPIVKTLLFTFQCHTYMDFSFKIVDA